MLEFNNFLNNKKMRKYSWLFFVFTFLSTSIAEVKVSYVGENLSFSFTGSTFTIVEINKTYHPFTDGCFITTFGTMSIINDGESLIDISLAIVSTTTRNKIVSTKPSKDKEFRFYSVFSSTIPLYDKFNYDDILSSVTKISSIDTFAISGESKFVKGYDISSGSTRTLFFRLDISTNISNIETNFYLKVTAISSEYVSEKISATNGGKIVLENKVELEVPAGSLTKDENISLVEKNKNLYSKLKNDIDAVAIYEFSPKGLIFRKPVKLTYYYKNKEISSEDEDKLRVYYWDGYDWRYVGGVVDKTAKTVSCNITHFSVYGLFPVVVLPSYKPLEKIITPVLKDGINDVATFDGLITENVNIKIFDITGRLVRDIEVLKEGNIWDGKDESGNIVESGVYIYQFEFNGKKYSGTIVVAK